VTVHRRHGDDTDFLPPGIFSTTKSGGTTVKSTEKHRVVVEEVQGENEAQETAHTIATHARAHRESGAVAAAVVVIDDDTDLNGESLGASSTAKRSASVTKKQLRAQHSRNKKQPAAKKPVSR
jgi:hypothetical protein